MSADRQQTATIRDYLVLPVDKALSLLLCCCLIATFYPTIYPVLFLLSAAAITIHCKRLLAASWLSWLGVYAVYALLTYARNPSLAEGATLNAVKLVVNFTFLAQAILWASHNRSYAMFYYFERTVAIIVGLAALQIFVYHAATSFAYLLPAASSAAASGLYNPKYAFFGGADKNIFGAKFAIYGFLYVLGAWVRTDTLPVRRIILVLGFAYLSASRTPMLALLIGIMGLILAQPGRVFLKGGALLLGLAASPFVLYQLIRIDDLTQMNDGFGIRLIYWLTFFQHLDKISIWGNGLLSGKSFLEHYSIFYNGEPQLHNLLLNNYLDFGVIGSVAYLLFFYCFFKYCARYAPSVRYWTVCLLPLLGVMLTLYTGYESDFVIYLLTIFVFSRAFARKESPDRLPGQLAHLVGRHPNSIAVRS